MLANSRPERRKMHRPEVNKSCLILGLLNHSRRIQTRLDPIFPPLLNDAGGVELNQVCAW
jgi:hypothetical protein